MTYALATRPLSCLSTLKSNGAGGGYPHPKTRIWDRTWATSPHVFSFIMALSRNKSDLKMESQPRCCMLVHSSRRICSGRMTSIRILLVFVWSIANLHWVGSLSVNGLNSKCGKGLPNRRWRNTATRTISSLSSIWTGCPLDSLCSTFLYLFI